MEDFGAFLREKRKAKGLTLKELVCRCEKQTHGQHTLDITILSRWETGKRKPLVQDRPIILAIADVLKLDDTEKNDLLLKAGLAPVTSDEIDIDSLLKSLGTRKKQSWYLNKRLEWSLERIAQKLGASIWDIRRDIEEEDLQNAQQLNPVGRQAEEHFNDLVDCAKGLVAKLRTYKEAAKKEKWLGNITVQEILENLEDDDFDDIEFFNKPITRGLLTHLTQSSGYDFPEFKTLHCWLDLELGKINEDLLKLIRLKAALRQFEGKCDLCS